MNFCPRCGKPVHPEAIFCGECGARLKDYEVAAGEGDAPATSSQPKKVQSSSGGIIRPGAEVRVFKDPMIDDDEVREVLGRTPGEADGPIDLSKAIKEGLIDTTPEDEDKEKKHAWDDSDLEDVLDEGSVVRRESLADERNVGITCRMCGEEVQVAEQLLKHRPLKVKCRACGFEWMIR